MSEKSTLPRPFPPAELTERLRRVQEEMARRSWSALVVADPANLYYLTGYNAWSFYVPQCVIVPAHGDLHFFGRPMDVHGIGHTTDLGPDRAHFYPESHIHRADIHPYDWIADRALDLGLLTDRSDVVVAAETDAHYFSARAFLALHARLRHATIVDSGELVNWVRLVKSPLEQDKLRAAGLVADVVMNRAIAAMGEGRRQCDVVAEIQAAQALGTPEFGGDYPAIVPMLPTGERAGTPHLTWTDTPFVRGEATTLELAGAYQRYHAPLARTVSLGPPSTRLADCAAAVTEGMHAALDALRPGAPARESHAAFTSVIARHGLTKDSRIGYSIGIGYPPDWGERTVSLRAQEETVLAAGMVFHVILGMWMDGWGYELSEPVLLTDAGAERLTHLPQELTVL